MLAAASGGRAGWEMVSELRFTDNDFLKICGLIRERAGINLGEEKKVMVYNRLASRLKATSAATFGHYIELLEQGDGGEWTEFTNALTTNLTYFFREPHHFAALRDHLRQQAGSEIVIWSSAASTGEEAYSIAMTVLEAVGSRGPEARILATDIDRSVLEVAMAGIYSAERVNQVPRPLRQRYFTRVPGPRERYRVIPELREMVTFLPFNLMEERWPLKCRYDAIFCRNVLIYFDAVRQQRLVHRMTELLRPGGLFFTGHSEGFLVSQGRLEGRGKSIFSAKPQPGDRQ